MYLGNESEKADPTFLKPTYDYDDEVDRQFGLHSRTQITILHVDGRRFPVYWIHYVCWRAYVTHMEERCARRIPGTIDPMAGIWHLPEEDILWAIFSSALIDDVKAIEGISSLQRALI
jgi:hypothetical protein